MRIHRTAPGPPRVALPILAAVHLALVLSVLVQDRPVIWPLHNDTIHREGRAADFYAVYHAGANARRGVTPYANDDDGVTPYFYPFRYLPVVAFAAQVFTVVPPETAYVVWILLVEGLLAVFLLALWRSMAGPWARVAAVGLLLLSSPYLLELHMGQTTFASTALCCLALLLPAGPVLFSASVLLKPMSLAAVPAFVRDRSYWLTAGCALLLVLLTSVPVFLSHPDQWDLFAARNFRLHGGLDAGNYGFVYFLFLLAGDVKLSAVLRHWDVVIGVIRLLALMTTAWVVFHSRQRDVRLGVAALLLAHFLTYQHVWEHHMSGVCVLAALLLTVPHRRRHASATLWLCFLLLALPTPFGLLDSAKDPRVWDPSQHWPRYASYVTVLSKVAPTFALYVAVMADLCAGGLLPPGEAIRAATTRARPRPPGARG